MNKNLVIAAIVILLILSAYFFVKSPPGKQFEKFSKQTATVAPTPSYPKALASATVYDPLAPEDKYQLKNGKGQLQQPDGPPVGFIQLGNKSTNVDTAIITTVAYNYGGSGVFIYLASFEEKEGYEMTSDVSLGDRVDVESITSNGDMVTVVYFDFGPDQAMADKPNVRVERKFTYAEETLTEVK